MFKYSIFFRGEESSLVLKASSENSPSVSYSLSVKDKGLLKMLDKYVDFTWSPMEIYSKINNFPSVTIKSSSGSETVEPEQESSEESSKDEEGQNSSAHGFRYSWSLDNEPHGEAVPASSDDEETDEEKVGD